MKTILNLPYEIIERILILSGNPSAFQINKRFSVIFQGVSLHVKKEFILGQANGNLVAGLQLLLRKRILEVPLINLFLYDILFTAASISPKSKKRISLIPKTSTPSIEELQLVFEQYCKKKSKKRTRVIYNEPFQLASGLSLSPKLNWSKEFKDIFTKLSLPLWIFKPEKKYEEKIRFYSSQIQSFEADILGIPTSPKSCYPCFYTCTKSYPGSADSCPEECINKSCAPELSPNYSPLLNQNNISGLKTRTSNPINSSKRKSPQHFQQDIYNTELNKPTQKSYKKVKTLALATHTQPNSGLIGVKSTSNVSVTRSKTFYDKKLEQRNGTVDITLINRRHYNLYNSESLVCYTRLCEELSIRRLCTTCTQPPTTRRLRLDEEKTRLLDIVHHLLSIGIPANSHKGLPLINSVINKNLDMAKLLLDFGADPNSNSGIATQVASANGDVDMLNLLFKHGAIANSKCQKLAVKNKRWNVVELLMRNNIMPDSTTLKMMTGV